MNKTKTVTARFARSSRVEYLLSHPEVKLFQTDLDSFFRLYGQLEDPTHPYVEFLLPSTTLPLSSRKRYRVYSPYEETYQGVEEFECPLRVFEEFFRPLGWQIHALPSFGCLRSSSLRGLTPLQSSLLETARTLGQVSPSEVAAIVEAWRSSTPSSLPPSGLPPSGWGVPSGSPLFSRGT